MEKVLDFKDLVYYYENGEKKTTILNGVNYSFEKGKLYTILGPSGSGKTTTLSLAGALDSPKGGDILYADESIQKIGYTRYRNSKIGVVFQSYNLLNYMNAVQNVMVAMEITENNIDRSRERAFSLLEHVGIDRDKAIRNINKLSGGEQQRVAIARAISTDADLILADEPTGNLDADTAEEIIKIFVRLAHEDGKCVISVTHSLDFAKKADVILKLEKGNMIESKLESA